MSLRRPSGRTGLGALLSARAVSILGSNVSLVAVPWLVLTMTGDPAQIGLVVAAGMVPYLLSGIFGTPVADRLGIKRSAVIADVVSMGCTATIAVVPDIGVPLIMVMVAISGTVRGTGDRAKTVLLRPMTEAAGAKLSRMTAVYSGIARGSMLVGAPVGGVLVAWLGPQHALGVDSLSYLLSAVITALLVHPPAELMPEPPRAEPYLVAVAGGARHLRRDHLLLVMVAMTFTANAANQANLAVFVPLWIQQTLRSPTALGTVFGVFAAGAVIGNLVLIGFAPKLPRFLTFALCLTVGGVPRLLSMALSDDLAVVLAVAFVSGFAMSGVNPILGMLLYERVPNELQTRVFGLVSTATFAGFPIGSLLGGWAVTGLGLTGALWWAAGIYLVVTLVPLARTRAAEKAAAATKPAST